MSPTSPTLTSSLENRSTTIITNLSQLLLSFYPVSICQRLIRRSHVTYTGSNFSSKDYTNSKFWNYRKHKKKDYCNVAPLRENGVHIFSDATGKANILNRQYRSVFNKNSRGCIPSEGSSTLPDMPPIKVTEDRVLKMLQSLNPYKAAGPDQISPMVLRKLASVLSRPLAILFQQSIDSGEVPQQREKVHVTPIFKKGCKNKPPTTAQSHWQLYLASYANTSLQRKVCITWTCIIY